MGIEIERKFLVNKELWQKVKPFESELIRQSYLSSEPDMLVRIRIAGNKGYITIKGKNEGITRLEFEYEIPFYDANSLIDTFAKHVIEKVRYYVLHENKKWMVDEFKGKNSGLILAEIELASIEEKFENPEWLGDEVTFDYKYANSNLSVKPYGDW